MSVRLAPRFPHYGAGSLSSLGSYVYTLDEPNYLLRQQNPTAPSWMQGLGECALPAPGYGPTGPGQCPPGAASYMPATVSPPAFAATYSGCPIPEQRGPCPGQYQLSGLGQPIPGSATYRRGQRRDCASERQGALQYYCYQIPGDLAKCMASDPNAKAYADQVAMRCFAGFRQRSTDPYYMSKQQQVQWGVSPAQYHRGPFMDGLGLLDYRAAAAGLGLPSLLPASVPRWARGLLLVGGIVAVGAALWKFWPKKRKNRRRRRNAKTRGGPVDKHAAHELVLFIENDGDLYRSMHQPIQKNLINKKAAGTFVYDKAHKAFRNLADVGAREYHRIHGGAFGPAWHQTFSTATRNAAAQELLDTFMAEARAGELDYLLHKKYQKNRRRRRPFVGRT